MNSQLTATAAFLATFLVLFGAPAHADGDVNVPDLQGAEFVLEVPGTSEPSQTSGNASEAVYTFSPTCSLGGQATCYGGAPCVRDGTEGIFYDVLLDGQKVGQMCVTAQQAAVGQEQVTPGMVARAFRRLDWPGSELVIQPPEGRTLVNFATNFYTEDDEAHQQSVRLLGHQVLIEAMPTGFTWRFGDGVSVRTAGPGAPYPALEVTHEYGSVGTFAPSVDVTYSGRYRVDGGGWVGIAETLTVPGAPQTLEAIEARPTLVDY